MEVQGGTAVPAWVNAGTFLFLFSFFFCTECGLRTRIMSMYIGPTGV